MAYSIFPISITIERFEEDIKPFFKSIRPQWNVEKLKTMKMQGGVSNILFGVYSDDVFKEGETDMVLIRIYGKILIDRVVEIENMAALASFDISAKVWAQFDNGCCYQFIHGTVMDEISIRQPEIYTLIIKEFVKLHTVKLGITRSKKPFIFDKMREMVNHLPIALNDVQRNKRYLNEFPNKTKIYEEIDELETKLVCLNSPVSFCHNDLLIKNMVININKDRVHMIDFEYADYNYCAFDIGNHFNEFAGFDNPDYSKYPDKNFQLKWLRQYLETLYLVQRGNGDLINQEVIKVDDSEVEHWYQMSSKFALVSHLFWSIWAIWQEMNSLIDFGYFEYGLIRWNEYRSRKEEFLSL